MHGQLRGPTVWARTAAAAAVTLAATAGLVGCSTTPSSSGDKRAANSPTATTASQAPGLPSGVRGAASLPTDIPNNADLRKNVSVTSCAATEGGWAANGSATNPGRDSVTYTITIYFTTTFGTVVDSGQTRVRIKGGAERPWTVSKKFSAAPSMLCALRGVG